MKYTIPYEDKITLPHIKEVVDLNIKTGDIYQKDEDLLGKVIVYGEYTLDNSEEDIIEFTHEIPVSLLVDDAAIEPVINYSDLVYELVKGRGIEIMFNLDVTLDNREEDFQEEIDRKLNEVIDSRDNIGFNEVNTELNQELNVFDVEEEVEEAVEINEAEAEVLEDVVEDIRDEEEVEVNEEDEEEVRAEAVEIEPEVEVEPEVLDELVSEEEVEELVDEEIEEFFEEDDVLSVTPSEDGTQFDIGFISNVNDRYTTYKIIILEDGEMIDDVLAKKELSKELLLEEYDSDGRKYVLKLEDE
jgi:hypothetical protein